MSNSRTVSRPLAFGLIAAAAWMLAGCVNNTALDDLKDTTPSGSPFSRSLYRDYVALAHSFGPVGAAAGVAFDGNGSMQLTSMDSDIGALANDYAEKALIAARGSVVEPEPGIDVPTHKMRDRLIRALDRGKDDHPVDTARAQADYDCWMMNAAVQGMAASAKRCLASLNVSLAMLEREAKPAPAAPPPPPPPADSDQPVVTP